MMGGPLLVAGPANPALAHRVAAELGIACAPCEFTRFPDGEVTVRVDESVRGRDVLLVQPTAPPVNDHLLELLAFADVCRRASARSLTAVIPYFGYARSDRRQGARVPIMASMVAELMEAVGVQHVVTLDVHSPQVEGFFRVPVDNLSAVPTLAAALAPHASREVSVVVAPDLGAVRLATEYGRRLDVPVAVVHKMRRSATEVACAGITGDVRGRMCLVVDDMITTGGTIEGAVAAVREAGAAEGVIVAATHGVLTDMAWERLARCDVRELVLTDSVAVTPRERPPTRVVSVAPAIAALLGRRASLRDARPAVMPGSG